MSSEEKSQAGSNEAEAAEGEPGHEPSNGQSTEDAEDQDHQFFIVGVGASAGGLEALGSLIGHISLDGMALVVVQHLAPKHESVLPALLSRASKVEVLAAED